MQNSEHVNNKKMLDKMISDLKSEIKEKNE